MEYLKIGDLTVALGRSGKRGGLISPFDNILDITFCMAPADAIFRGPQSSDFGF